MTQLSLWFVQQEWNRGSISPVIYDRYEGEWQGAYIKRWKGICFFHHMEDGAEEWLRKQIALYSLTRITGV
jgi:hypothetical protein